MIAAERRARMVATAVTSLIRAASIRNYGGRAHPPTHQTFAHRRPRQQEPWMLRSPGSMHIRRDGEHMAVKLLNCKLGADNNQDH
jgi:hypothetical protein